MIITHTNTNNANNANNVNRAKDTYIHTLYHISSACKETYIHIYI